MVRVSLVSKGKTVWKYVVIKFGEFKIARISWSFSKNSYYEIMKILWATAPWFKVNSSKQTKDKIHDSFKNACLFKLQGWMNENESHINPLLYQTTKGS